MELLHRLLRESFAGGHRTAVVFTQYTDTLDYIRAPLKMENLDSVPRQKEELSPVMDLKGLQENLFSVRAVMERFREHPEFDDAWLLDLGGEPHGVTFEQSVYQDKPGLSLLSWGNALLDALLEAAGLGEGELPGEEALTGR